MRIHIRAFRLPLRTLALILLIFFTTNTFAQNANTCAVPLDQVIATAGEACSGLDANIVCYGGEAVSVALNDNNEAAWEIGDRFNLQNVATIYVSTADLESTWGIAMLTIQANLPDNAMNMVLFGEAEINNLVEVREGPLPTVTVQNIAGYGINLREGPGTNFPTAGTMNGNDVFTGDGQNATGEWFRVQTDDGIAWVHHSLISIDGNTEELAVLDSPYTEPMQAFTLTTTNSELCGVATSGLLIQLTGENKAQIQVNGVALEFETAALLLQAVPNEDLQIHVLEGDVEVTAQNSTVAASTDQSVRVELGGDETLSPVSSPLVSDHYSFAAVGGAPVELLDTADLVCVAGLPYNTPAISVYTGPGEDYGISFNMDTETHYSVTGFAPDDNEQNWWQLNTGRGQSWVPETGVHTAGLCGNIAQVEPPTLISTSTTDSGNLVPAGQSVWQANSGDDMMTGECSGPPLRLCAHLAAIITNPDGTIQWRGQEPTPYTLSPTGLNNYRYSGRSVLNNANVTLELTMTGTNTWSLVFSRVFDNDPGCTHTFYYTATREW